MQTSSKQELHIYQSCSLKKLAVDQMHVLVFELKDNFCCRFEHSLGVAHLAGKQALHFCFSQPELNITHTDLKLVELAGTHFCTS